MTGGRTSRSSLLKRSSLRACSAESLVCCAADVERTCAYYTVDKKEVPDRHWPVVSDILKQLGLESQNTESRTLTISHDLCRNFEERVLVPWHDS